MQTRHTTELTRTQHTCTSRLRDISSMYFLEVSSSEQVTVWSKMLQILGSNQCQRKEKKKKEIYTVLCYLLIFNMGWPIKSICGRSS